MHRRVDHFARQQVVRQANGDGRLTGATADQDCQRNQKQESSTGHIWIFARPNLSSNFPAIPSLGQTRVLELAHGESIERRKNVALIGAIGTGKTSIAFAPGLAVCK